jgi:hypothetical protein
MTTTPTEGWEPQPPEGFKTASVIYTYLRKHPGSETGLLILVDARSAGGLPSGSQALLLAETIKETSRKVCEHMSEDDIKIFHEVIAAGDKEVKRIPNPYFRDSGHQEPTPESN